MDWGDRYGVSWYLWTEEKTSPEDAEAVYYRGMEDQMKAGATDKLPVENMGRGKQLYSGFICMLNLVFGDPRGAPTVAEQIAALVPRIPFYEEYAVGKDRVSFAEPLEIRWEGPTLAQILAGLYQFAAVSNGPPAYFEGYHPRKQNCQAFVFDAVGAVLHPPTEVSPYFGATVDWVKPAASGEPQVRFSILMSSHA